MSSKTKLSISGLSVEVDGKTKYRLDAACIEEGDLPDRKIFLYEIGNVTDPSTDNFLGVAEAGDFGLYVNSREEALRVNALRYRGSYVSRVYDTVEEFAAAKRALTDYVNALVLSYIEYSAAAGNETFEAPSTTPEYITELKNAFLTALADYTTKLSDYNSAKTDYNNAQTTYNTANTTYNTWLVVDAGVQAVNQAFMQFITAVNSEPGIAEHPNLITAAQIANTAYNTFQTTVGKIQSEKSTSYAAVATAASDVTSKGNVVYTTYSSCKAAYDTAAAKLEAVKDYDSDWYNTQKEALGDAPAPPES